MTPEFPRSAAVDGAPSIPPAKDVSMPGSALQRFIGGPPVAVFVRLLFVSLIVGALLIWLDIRPYEVFHALQRFANRLWMMGFDAVREVAQYVLAGAAIVLPVWLIMRLFNMRGAR
jgi:hypothetical protein